MQNSDFPPLIVQGDRTLLLDTHAASAQECRRALIPFAELERSPEHLHTYRLTALSLWNAASAGLAPDYPEKILKKYSRFAVPQSVCEWIRETALRFGKLRLIPDDGIGKDASENTDTLLLYTDSYPVYCEIKADKKLQKYLVPLSDYSEAGTGKAER